MSSFRQLAAGPVLIFVMVFVFTIVSKSLSLEQIPGYKRIRRDFLALSRRSTTRHLLVSTYEECLALKLRIKKTAEEEKLFLIDVFGTYARDNSLDKETAMRNGLLGEMAPQGYTICPELDRACFTYPLGEVSGPLQSDYGYHLVLVCERTFCPKLDGKNTRVIRGDDGYSVVLSPPKDGSSKTLKQEVTELSFAQIGFWAGIALSGGIVAELLNSLSHISSE